MKYAIAIDIGGTTIKYALINSKGDVIKEGITPTLAQESYEKVISQLFVAIDNVLTFVSLLDEPATIVGIGVGTPGIIDKTNRIVLGGAENIIGWENLSLAQIIEEEYELNTVLINDANAMALGEFSYGAGKDSQDVLFITVGTGIGGAAIINGKLFSGFENRGGEFGHISLIADGIPCACGSVGCLEAYASTSALIKQYSEGLKEQGASVIDVDGKLIVDRYKSGEPLAALCMDKHFDYLGRGIAGLVNIFSPQKVIIGGGISEAGDFYVEEINSYFNKYVMPDCGSHTVLNSADLGNKAGMIGAASHAFNNL